MINKAYLSYAGGTPSQEALDFIPAISKLDSFSGNVSKQKYKNQQFKGDKFPEFSSEN